MKYCKLDPSVWWLSKKSNILLIFKICSLKKGQSPYSSKYSVKGNRFPSFLFSDCSVLTIFFWNFWLADASFLTKILSRLCCRCRKRAAFASTDPLVGRYSRLYASDVTNPVVCWNRKAYERQLSATKCKSNALQLPIRKFSPWISTITTARW